MQRLQQSVKERAHTVGEVESGSQEVKLEEKNPFGHSLPFSVSFTEIDIRAIASF